MVEPLGKERQYETVMNGKTFLVSEIKQALFPTREGILKIDPAKVQCEVMIQTRRRGGFFDDSFFGFSRTEPKVLHADPIVLEVKPLPAEGKTPLFSSLVGNFDLVTSLSKKQLEVGDTTTLTITIKGEGNIRDAHSPEFPSPAYFKVYDDKPILTVQNSGDVFGGTLTIKKALVPLKEGTLKVPSLVLTFFNPEFSRYELCKSKPLTMQVLPPKDKEKLHLVEAMGTTTSKEEIKILGKDILPIHTSLSALKPYRLDIWYWTYMALFFLPIAGYTGCTLIKRRKERLEEDLGYARSKDAMKKFNKNIIAAKKQIRNEDSAEFYRRTSKALKDFLGDKLNLTGSALTPAEIVDQWIASGIIKKCELDSYVFQTAIQTQHLLNLLSYLAITVNNPSSELYRKKYITLSTPAKLSLLHSSLQQSTILILQEELSHCTARLKQLTQLSGFPSNDSQKHSHSKVCDRRRDTTNITYLQRIKHELQKLISCEPYWRDHFRPVCIKMLFDDNNLGYEFEEFVAQYFSQNNYVTIQHASVMVGNYPREIDLLAFGQKADLSVERMVISCSDNSHYESKFSYAKKTILSRLNEVEQFKRICSFTKCYLFVRVANKVQQQVVEEWTKESEEVTVVIVIKDEIVNSEEILKKCHREVSFESIYIVRLFFGGFILYVYRKVSIKIETIEKKKEEKKDSQKSLYRYYLRLPLLITA